MLADTYGQMNGLDQQNQDAATRTFAGIAHDTLQSVAEITAENRTAKKDANAAGRERFAIVDSEKGKYVQHDRSVLSGTDPVQWGKQITDYINNEIRHGRDVTVYAENGTPLTITRDTAGKAAFRNMLEIPGTGQRRLMTDEEYAVKLRAESHIDELAQVSKGKGKTAIDRKHHSFAADGFNYRTAYYNDPTGYYRLQISVGKNGKVQAVYNVAQIEKASFPTVRAQGSNRSKTETGNMLSANNMPQNSNFVNRENQGNTGRATFSMEDDDLNSAETYTYEHLTAQPDMQIVQVGNLSDFLKNGKIDRGAVKNAGLENAARVGRMLSDNIASVQNRYTGRDIQISGASIRHGLDGSFVRVSVNSKLGSVIGELAKTAIPVNSMLPNDLNIEYTYPMAAWATDGTNEYLALLHVDRYGENVKNVELLDVVHSLNGRIRKNSTTAAMPTRSADLSAPSNAVSKVSIADLLELVKDLHPDVYYTIPRTVRELQLNLFAPSAIAYDTIPRTI